MAICVSRMMGCNVGLTSVIMEVNVPLVMETFTAIVLRPTYWASTMRADSANTRPLLTVPKHKIIIVSTAGIVSTKERGASFRFEFALLVDQSLISSRNKTHFLFVSLVFFFAIVPMDGRVPRVNLKVPIETTCMKIAL
jgi:hypothetical protein